MQELYDSYYTKSIVEFLHALCSLTVAAVLVALASRLDPASAGMLLMTIWLVVFISLVWSLFQFVAAIRVKQLLRQVLEIRNEGKVFVPRRFKIGPVFLLMNTLSVWFTLPIRWPSQQFADSLGILRVAVDISYIVIMVIFFLSFTQKMPADWPELKEPPKWATIKLTSIVSFGLFLGALLLIIIFLVSKPQTAFIDQNWATSFFAATMLILAGQLFVSLYKKPTQFRVKLYN